ncbi:MAG: gluconate 2-dehydrogenase subunit 3 family protein [Verrucomicrobiales bacterium]
MTRIDRRVALEWMLSATASIPLLSRPALGQDEVAAPPGGKGYGPDPDVIKAYQPGDLWPLTFSDRQRRLVVVLCDIVIPADDQSPSASSQGVHDFLDEWISSPYPAQASDRKLVLEGLAWLDEEAERRGATDFVSLDPAEQTAVCRELARDALANARQFPGSFFKRLRDLVSGGYYTTPVGMQDLGYRGNVAVAEWNGPPREVLERLGLV